MGELSAGILLFRTPASGTEVLLGHPGGPFWRHRDLGAWTIPKGGVMPGETLEQAARREFAEETGQPALGPLIPLGRIQQGRHKEVEAFALAGTLDPLDQRSNSFELEWPPRSGRRAVFPEVDRVAWFSLAAARTRILPAQQPLLDRLESLLPDAAVTPQW
ncbi:NUDIX domain-containing protein [Xanthobacter sp. ZOL 2024]